MVSPALHKLDNAWITVEKLFPAQSTNPVYESSPQNTLGQFNRWIYNIFTCFL